MLRVRRTISWACFLLMGISVVACSTSPEGGEGGIADPEGDDNLVADASLVDPMADGGAVDAGPDAFVSPPACDDGIQNGLETGVDCGGACAACPIAPACDDGIKNGLETGTDCGGTCAACPPPTGCFPNAKRIFVTSRGYDGDLRTNGGASSGLEGADNLCNAHADEAGLGGEWIAWLSTATIDAYDRIPNAGPWYLVDECTKVFSTKLSIINTGPLADIDMTEQGSAKSSSVWTGTDADGQRAPWHCEGWESDSQFEQAVIGLGSNPFAGAWTETSTPPCHHKNALVCFEK